MQTDARKLKRLTMTRGACLGTCPVYEVAVTADGRVTWRGEAHVATIGPATWTLPGDRVAQVEAALDRAGFAGLTEDDEAIMTDVARCTVLVEYADGSSKDVTRLVSGSPPRGFLALARRLDRLLGTAPHVGPGTQPWRGLWRGP